MNVEKFEGSRQAWVGCIWAQWSGRIVAGSLVVKSQAFISYVTLNQRQKVRHSFCSCKAGVIIIPASQSKCNEDTGEHEKTFPGWG